jgi:uncharacterized protein (TIGR02266 family)
MADDTVVRRSSGVPEPGTKASERRILPRFHVELEITFESEHNFFMGFTENLSEGGLFVATHLVKPIGSVIDLKFKLPGREQPIEAKGEVRWVRPYQEHNDVPPGMGIRFVDINSAQEAEVKAFLRARTPIFYDE